jgi:CheY-like chemotaxis protein
MVPSGSFDGMLTVALLVPNDVGEKVTSNEQVPEGATVAVNGEDRDIVFPAEHVYMDAWSRDELRIMGQSEKWGFVTLWKSGLDAKLAPKSVDTTPWKYRQNRAMDAHTLQHGLVPTWADYDLVVWSSGDDTSPVADAAYRSSLNTYVASQRRGRDSKRTITSARQVSASVQCKRVLVVDECWWWTMNRGFARAWQKILNRRGYEVTQSLCVSAALEFLESGQGFDLVIADLMMPQGVDMASRQVHNGISMRIVRQYDINNDRMPCRIDVLYGYSVIRPQMGVRLWG